MIWWIYSIEIYYFTEVKRERLPTFITQNSHKKPTQGLIRDTYCDQMIDETRVEMNVAFLRVKLTDLETVIINGLSQLYKWCLWIYMEIEPINLLKNSTLVGKRYFPTQDWLHLMDIQFIKINQYFNLYCYIIMSQKILCRKRRFIFVFSP